MEAVRVGGPGEEPPQKKEGGIPWGEWDAATCDTTLRGVIGCRDARINVRPLMSICEFMQGSKQIQRGAS